MVKLQYLTLLAIAISSIVVLSVTLPAASALTQRDKFDDTKSTYRWLGGQKICGDHLCKPGEYNKFQKAMFDAQRSAAVCREALKQGKKC